MQNALQAFSSIPHIIVLIFCRNGFSKFKRVTLHIKEASVLVKLPMFVSNKPFLLELYVHPFARVTWFSS